MALLKQEAVQRAIISWPLMQLCGTVNQSSSMAAKEMQRKDVNIVCLGFNSWCQKMWAKQLWQPMNRNHSHGRSLIWTVESLVSGLSSYVVCFLGPLSAGLQTQNSKPLLFCSLLFVVCSRSIFSPSKKVFPSLFHQHQALKGTFG